MPDHLIIESLDHWITRSLDHWIIGSLEHWIIRMPDHLIIESLDNWSIVSLDHWNIESLDHWIINIWNRWIIWSFDLKIRVYWCSYQKRTTLSETDWEGMKHPWKKGCYLVYHRTDCKNNNNYPFKIAKSKTNFRRAWNCSRRSCPAAVGARCQTWNLLKYSKKLQQGLSPPWQTTRRW